MKQLLLYKPDSVGVFTSFLCIIHCLVAPFLFIANVSIANKEPNAPLWWKSLDYIFITIAFFAVYRSTKTTSKNYMKFAFWGSYILLFLTIINEKFMILELPEFVTYTSASILAIVHIYNLKYCQCKTKNCCK